MVTLEGVTDPKVTCNESNVTLSDPAHLHLPSTNLTWSLVKVLRPLSDL